MTDDQIKALEFVLLPMKDFNRTPENLQFIKKATGKSFLDPFKSHSGFIAPGENLVDIIKKDKKYLDSLALSFKEVGEMLSQLINANDKLHGVDYPYEIKIKAAYLGDQYCPFCLFNPHLSSASHGGYPRTNRDITIKNVYTKKRISFSGLLPHMILKHHFFEGRVKYRLKPKKVVKVLELT